MLLLHGYPLSGALFSRNREALAAQYQVITADHRGYGMSEAPGTPDDVAVYASDAMAVLDELGVDQAIIGGHSMGGSITFEMYQMAPTRGNSSVICRPVIDPPPPVAAVSSPRPGSGPRHC